MIKMLNLIPPAPNGPGLFRFAESRLMEEVFIAHGLNDIGHSVVEPLISFRDVDEYWSFISEVASPLTFSRAAPDLQRAIREKVTEKLLERYDRQDLAIRSSATVLSGTKPNN
jgi:hypothetical protein